MDGLSHFRKYLAMTTIDLDARFDPRELRNALGRFATGIAVVMAQDEEGPIGVTVNSFSSVSLDPPLILFSMARSLHSLARLEKAKAYSVNILLENQQEISNRFARAGEDKFSATPWEIGPSGAPRLVPAHAIFECVPYAHYDGGDHVIFVGRVVHLHAEGEGDPLLYYRGSYRLLAAIAQEG
ncbi:MAG: flavin reductase family protein [Rhizobiales bacterium]|uniref:Flavin reductase like domain-containing protein n=2 Tax=Xanthobacter flavus TaxID=281 RepID=A0A9W6CRY0_XANFL|nr:flavin reductase family protein [Hyphomicrobiales bacterium]UJX44384.1 flavin reductase [Xanthobacter sp. YC-JY1]GLI22778.1 hypothetical protein XFLAVUS301_24520 [Xanthobacter flavus]